MEGGKIHTLLGTYQGVTDPSFAVGGKDHARRRSRIAREETEPSVGDEDAIDRLSGKCRPEADHRDLPAGVGGHVPERGDSTRRARDRLFRPRLRIELDEIHDAVLERALAGHHRGPYQRDDGREVRLEHATGALAHQHGEIGHRTSADVIVQQFPIDPAQSDEEDGRRRFSGAGDRLDRGGHHGWCGRCGILGDLRRLAGACRQQSDRREGDECAKSHDAENKATPRQRSILSRALTQALSRVNCRTFMTGGLNGRASSGFQAISPDSRARRPGPAEASGRP